MNEKIIALLDKHDYRVKIKKEKYGLSLNLPYNEMLDLKKEIIDYKVNIGIRTGFWKNTTFFEVPEYAIRLAISYDIFFICQQRGYDINYVKYMDENDKEVYFDEIMPISKTQKTRALKLSNYVTEFVENRANYDRILVKANKSKVKEGFDFLVNNLLGGKNVTK